MKKWMLALLLVMVLIVAYTMLPGEVYIQQQAKVKINANSAYRLLADKGQWNKWWPKQEQASQGRFTFENYTYDLQQGFFQSLVIKIHDENGEVNSSLSMVPLGIDYTILEWKAGIQGNTAQKVQTYLKAKKMQGKMEELLEALKGFLEKEENVYGFKVNLAKVKDTTLIATKFISSAYPSTDQVYQHINSLREYLKNQKATETNYPMLHVQQLDSGRFESMVAIPTNKELRENGDIMIKRMVRGNILEAKVRGGTLTCREAMVQLDHYKADHQFASPAIPFMSLITDRSQEKDTAKWVTGIFYPVY